MLAFILVEKEDFYSSFVKNKLELLSSELNVEVISYTSILEINEKIKACEDEFFITIDGKFPLQYGDYKKMEREVLSLSSKEGGVIIKRNQYAFIAWWKSAVLEDRKSFVLYSSIPVNRYIFAEPFLRIQKHWKWRKKNELNNVGFITEQEKMEDKYIYPVIQHLYAPKKRLTVKSSPFFSIVICTYNNAEYISWAVLSVLAQSILNWEIIIIDDGSTDETAEALAILADHPSIHIIYHKVNRGKAFCLNSAIQLVRGEWMIELDADDWLSVDSLEKLMQSAKKIGPEVALIYGNFIEWRERYRDKKLFYSKEHKGIKNLAINEYLNDPMPLAPRIYRVEHLKEVNGWCLTDIYQGRLFEDVYIICRLAKHKKLHHLNDSLYHRRLRRNSVSNKQKNKFEHWKKWLKKELKK